MPGSRLYAWFELSLVGFSHYRVGRVDSSKIHPKGMMSKGFLIWRGGGGGKEMYNPR